MQGIASNGALSFRLYPVLRSLAQLALAIGLLAALLWRVDIRSVREELQQADVSWLPLAFVANLLSDWFRAIRQQVLLRPLRRLGVPFLFATSVLGVACNLALPFRAGEFIRVQVLRQRTGLNVPSIVAALVSEKLADVIAFAAFVVVGIVIYEEARFLWPLAVLYAGVLITSIFVFRWLAGRSDPPVRWPGAGRWSSWLGEQLRAFGQGLQAFRAPRALAVICGASVLAWVAEAVMYYAVGQAIGIDLPFAVYLLVVVVATLAVSVPLTQAGLGVFELALTGLLAAFDVNRAQAATFAIVAHVTLALPYFVSGPLAAVALKLSLSDVVFLRLAREEAPAAEAAAEASA